MTAKRKKRQQYVYADFCYGCNCTHHYYNLNRNITHHNTSLSAAQLVAVDGKFSRPLLSHMAYHF